ncbi:hypothetical protein Q8A67_016992 [Cirrhinus molitorella]|uniref:Uncharacterized protein n=1 Tax=Cirrhinus molitorella TaxID=172907 RepID=A0AA88TH03_9TELE|nr:hypothetical protein Q8A67_016992 [Cirrhinus molitorella]
MLKYNRKHTNAVRICPALARSDYVRFLIASRPCASHDLAPSLLPVLSRARRSNTRCSSLQTERRHSTLINALYCAVPISGSEV